MQTYTFSEGVGDRRIDATAILCGEDVVVVIGGGTRHHTGAVAVAISHPRIKDPARLEATATVVTVPGHKEDQLARETALTLARALRTTVTVSVGIHIDDASADDIALLVATTRTLTEQMAVRLEAAVRDRHA